MVASKSQPTDAPRVQIETTGALGQTTVQQISLDSNRLRVKTESLQRFSNFIAIPSRGMWLDCVQWVLSVAMLIRVVLSLGMLTQSYAVLGIGWGLMALMAAFPLVSVFTQVPDMRMDCFFRFCQINAGVVLATQAFWIMDW